MSERESLFAPDGSGHLRVIPEVVFAVLLARYRHDGLAEDHDALTRHDARLRARELRLAQALRVLRDTTSQGEYVYNVASRALLEAGIEEPPDEDEFGQPLDDPNEGLADDFANDCEYRWEHR